jgi:DNA polymerase-3 subunit alpha
MEFPGSLHSHTQYSNLRLKDCIVKENELIEYAGELGHKVIAITDHETTSCYLKAQEAWRKVQDKYPNLKLILGNEIYLVRNGLNKDNFKSGIDHYYHFILLAKDREGVKQIQQISTNAWMRSYMARGMRRVPTYYQDLDIIKNNKGHVIGSSACLGSCIDIQLIKYKETQDKNLYEKIKNWILKIDNIFGHGDFYLELQPSNTKEQIYVNKELIKLSKKLDIPYIITNDVHYLKQEDRKIHKAFLNSQNGEREVDTFYSSTFLMNTQQVESYCSYLTREELDIAYKNIEEIGNKCEIYDLRKPLKIPELKWREFEHNENKYEQYLNYLPELEKFYKSQDKADKELVFALIDGIERHKDLQCKEAYKELNNNLEITWKSSEVNKAHWSAYFLNLQKIIDICWEAGSLCGIGRGSAGGFLLLYALDIIQMNKLREKSPTFAFRFLNPERASVLD